MARAHNIFVVVTDGTRVPVAAFTVKRECRAWLLKQSDIHREYTQVAVMRDGGPSNVSYIHTHKFLEQSRHGA